MGGGGGYPQLTEPGYRAFLGKGGKMEAKKGES